MSDLPLTQEPSELVTLAVSPSAGISGSEIPNTSIDDSITGAAAMTASSSTPKDEMETRLAQIQDASF